jgi:hypothetical protein
MKGVVALSVALLVLSLGSAAAGRIEWKRTVEFQLPSLAVACAYTSGTSGQATLRCDLLGQLDPWPHKACPPKPNVSWHAVSMTRRGRARPLCVDDTVFKPLMPVLRGRTWRAQGFRCTVIRGDMWLEEGIRCRNLDGHGFFVSPARWIAF